jgi:hypothetical protein
MERAMQARAVILVLPLCKLSQFKLPTSPDNLFRFAVVMIFLDRIDLSEVAAFPELNSTLPYSPSPLNLFHHAFTCFM